MYPKVEGELSIPFAVCARRYVLVKPYESVLVRDRNTLDLLECNLDYTIPKRNDSKIHSIGVPSDCLIASHFLDK